jgi:hypothetical protein
MHRVARRTKVGALACREICGRHWSQQSQVCFLTPFLQLTFKHSSTSKCPLVAFASTFSDLILHLRPLSSHLHPDFAGDTVPRRRVTMPLSLSVPTPQMIFLPRPAMSKPWPPRITPGHHVPKLRTAPSIAFAASWPRWSQGGHHSCVLRWQPCVPEPPSRRLPTGHLRLSFPAWL